MFDTFHHRSRCFGSALFRGAVPRRIALLDGLAAHGLAIEPGPASDDAQWTATLRHAAWGTAEAACLCAPPVPDRRLLALDPKLTERDVDDLSACGGAISVSLEGDHGFVPRDRKLLLRFLHALLGADGVAALDHTAQAVWTRPALEDELAHDADLDVESLYVVHAITSDDDRETVTWLHTHGLAELGRFDFDILAPCRAFVENSVDFCRALAFSILEDRVRPGARGYELARPFTPLDLVPAGEFMRKAAPVHTALRDDPFGTHRNNRVVLCEPVRARRRPRPVRAFGRPLPGNLVVNVPADATVLVADRARRTYPVLRAIADEFADLHLPVLAKLGYVVDGGAPDECEHLWFEVHELDDESIDATLVNSPWNIARMKEGDRGRHAVELLTDWSVVTPFGPITPRVFHARRLLREHRGKLSELVRRSREQ